MAEYDKAYQASPYSAAPLASPPSLRGPGGISLVLASPDFNQPIIPAQNNNQHPFHSPSGLFQMSPLLDTLDCYPSSTGSSPPNFHLDGGRYEISSTEQQAPKTSNFRHRQAQANCTRSTPDTSPQPIIIYRQPGNIKRYQCPWKGCEKEFTQSYNIKPHYLLHTNGRQFKCPSCPLAFARARDLGRHQMSVHKDIKEFVCSACDSKFGRRDSLLRHQARPGLCAAKSSNSLTAADAAASKGFECLYCHDFFSRRDSLQRHLQTCRKL
ncbi:hypothetical protein BDR26DRAFT_868914 [Obelidium mucronatum]|nr:hypothetical protein BDR26DRAFT_868914 [Obelidium mucronatum]